MYNAGYDWGTIENRKVDLKQLAEVKQGCEPHCFSTLEAEPNMYSGRKHFPGRQTKNLESGTNPWG